MDEFDDAIMKFDYEAYVDRLNAFFKKYRTYDDGRASDRVINIIVERTQDKTEK